MLSRALVALWILALASITSASPLYYRSPTNPSPTSTTLTPTQSTGATDASQSSSISGSDTSRSGSNVNDLTLDWMWTGNGYFRDYKDDIMQDVETAPKALFLGCSDSKLSPEVVFQTDAGTTRSHFNLANQFTGQDPSSSAAIEYAINELKVKHIVVFGHYGCKHVEKATGQLSDIKSTALRTWLKPVADLYTQSKRFEIRRLRALRKGSDLKSTTDATPSGLRALVEENVKTSVQNLQKEIMTILGDGYKDTDLYVHGLVVDEGTGDVVDLNVSFGPPGKVMIDPPFNKAPKARMHVAIGKFDAKKKKVDPVATGDVTQATFSVDSTSRYSS